MASTLSIDSVSNFTLQNTDRPDMNLATESKRILFVLDQTISRAKFVAVLKSLVADDGFLLSDVLDSEDHFYIVQTCRKYEFTGVKFSHRKDSAVESTIITEEKGTLASSQSKETSSASSETDEENENGSFLESPIYKKKPLNVASRVDSELSKLILMLEKNPQVHKLIAKIQDEISPQMRFFIKCMKELREGIALHLGESAEEEKKREAYLRECYLKNEKAKKEIARLEQELLEHKMDKNYCIIGRDVLINRHQNKINKIRQSSAEAIDKRVKESEKAMANDWKISVALQDKLKEELQATTTKYEQLLRDDLATEKMFRTKRAKLENQLIGWLQKFDQDIGEKQAEEEEIQTLLDEQNIELEKIRLKLEEQEEEYDELMQEKAEYEMELLEQRLYIFILNRSARRIQRYFRQYKAKKLAKKKEKDRRGKKGGKKK